MLVYVLNKVTVKAAALTTAEQRCGGSIGGSSTVTGRGSNSGTFSANTKYTYIQRRTIKEDFQRKTGLHLSIL